MLCIFFKLTAATLGVVPNKGVLILVFAQKGESGGPRVKMILIFTIYSVSAQEHSEAESLEWEEKKKNNKTVFYIKPFQISPLRKETDSKSFVWTEVKIQHTAQDIEKE